MQRLAPFLTPFLTPVLTLMLALAAGPAPAAELPEGVTGARLLPGWVTPDGVRMTALSLDLAPGWKTYWRSPGDTGLPPVLDWSGSQNLGAARLHWPAPEAIASDGEVTLGYHDALVLPIEITPAGAGPVAPHLRIDLGLCRDICVPAHLDLTAPPPGAAPDPAITAALAQVPVAAEGRPDCRVAEIADGMRVSVTLPGPAPRIAALELADAPQVWASSTTVNEGIASADFVGPSAKPFALDPAGVVLTLVADAGATEHRGCTPRP